MNAPFDQEMNNIAAVLRDQDNFLVVSHENPDGDAVGSMAAMGHLLHRLGKRFELYSPGGLREDFAWLLLPRPMLGQPPEMNGQWVITLDCGDLQRLDAPLVARVANSRIINIDHHLGNPAFGSLNLVDTTASSTGEIVARLARLLGIALDGPLGQAVYLSLITDTGNFSYDNTTPDTLELAAHIVRLGLKPGPFNALVQNSYTMPRVKLLSTVLSQAKLLHDGRVGVVRISAQAMRETGTGPVDSDGLINFVRRIRGVQVAIGLREEGPASIKFSLRSTGKVNVQTVAAQFGGGGHRNASGGRLALSLDDAETRLVDAVEPLLVPAEPHRQGQE